MGTVALVALFLSSTALHAATVREVVLLGLESIPEQTVRALLKVTEGTEYSEEAVLRDLTAIMDLGMFDGTSSVNAQPLPNGLRLVYELVEHPKIANVALVGVTLVPEEELRAAIAEFVKPGAVFCTRYLNVIYERLRDVYAKRGFHVAMDPPKIDANGNLTLNLIEAKVSDVRSSIGGGDYVKTEPLLQWLGPAVDGFLNVQEVEADRTKALTCGLFAALAVEVNYGPEPGRAQVNYIGELLPRPYPIAEAAPFINPPALVASLTHYRDEYFDSHFNPFSPTPPDAMAARQAAYAAGNVDEGFRLVLDHLRLQQVPEARALAATIEATLDVRHADGTIAPAEAVQLGRLKLLLGKRYDAVTILSPMLTATPVPSEAYASLLQAAVMRLAEVAATESATTVPEGADLAWAEVLLGALSLGDPKLALDPASQIPAAVHAGLDHFDGLGPDALYAELAAYARFVSLCDYLNELPEPVRPASLDPRLADRVGLPIAPTYYDPRVLGALEAKLGAEPTNAEARYAFADVVVHEEVSLVLSDTRLAGILKLDAESRRRDLGLAQAYLTETCAQSEAQYPFARGLLATAMALAGDVKAARETLLPAFDRVPPTGAGNLFVTTAYLDMVVSRRSDAEVRQNLTDALTTIRQHVATAQGVAPEARETQYRLESELGLIDDALVSAKRHADAAPGDGDPLAAESFFELKKSQWDVALRTAQRALAVEPQNPWVQYTLGLAILAAGDSAKAVPYLKAMENETVEHRQAHALGV